MINSYNIEKSKLTSIICDTSIQGFTSLSSIWKLLHYETLEDAKTFLEETELYARRDIVGESFNVLTDSEEDEDEDECQTNNNDDEEDDVIEENVVINNNDDTNINDSATTTVSNTIEEKKENTEQEEKEENTEEEEEKKVSDIYLSPRALRKWMFEPEIPTPIPIKAHLIFLIESKLNDAREKHLKCMDTSLKYRINIHKKRIRLLKIRKKEIAYNEELMWKLMKTKALQSWKECISNIT